MKTSANQQDNQLARQMANCIRFLSIDAVERAASGHPGMPMGMADVATILFGEFLKFDAANPRWIDRDRFVLSAGHGSMLLYSLLYLTGYKDISLDDLKNFRQLHSKAAGHPEFGEFLATETTTGPLGQGIANAVGMALAEEMLAARLGRDVINHKTYCIAGDGCLMEGISQEAISIAGHLGLKNLIVLWDDNAISIDGDVALASSENMKLRFEACGWKVLQIDGHDFDQIRNALQAAQNADKPVMIACKTVIAYGSPNKAGSEKSHGSPLGAAEIAATRQKLDWAHEPFVIPQNLLDKWREFGARNHQTCNEWQKKYDKLDDAKKSEFERALAKKLPKDFHEKLQKFEEKIIAEKPKQATRKSSQIVLEFLNSQLPELIGGSADLTESVLTKTSQLKSVNKNDFSGRYIHYGIREHAMGALMNGMALHGGFIPYGGTFLVFCDYMKPAIRLASLMKQQVIYIFTHDSIGLGEDGPTHQPIEHLASLRAIPNLNVFRPSDAQETISCFAQALAHKDSPSAMVLTRQNLEFIENKNSAEIARGAYVISNCDKNVDVNIIATGSEVMIALKAKEKLQAQGLNVKVVSAPCLTVFDKQDQDYKNKILSGKIKVAIEAGISQGWHQYIGSDGIFIGMNSFGASAKAEDLYKHFKITAEEIINQVTKKL